MSTGRQDEIAALVDAHGRMALGDLATRFGVSEMTVRRDLDALTTAGRLQRVRGGAIAHDAVTTPPPAPPVAPSAGGAMGSGAEGRGGRGAAPAPGPGGALQRRAALERAADLLAADVEPGSSVLLCSGPGSVDVATRLRDRAPLTVAVTGLEAALALAGSPGVRLVVLGGTAEPGEGELGGPAALAALAELHVDLAVLLPPGLDASGVWVRSPAAAALARAAAAAATRTAALVAPEALGARHLVRALPVTALDSVITTAPDGAAEPRAAGAARAVLEELAAARSRAPRVAVA